MRLVPALALAPLVLLAGCDWWEGDEEDDRTASGQVLEGTISDSMLPLDTVRSQPPLAKSTGGSSDGGGPDAEATDAPEEGEESPVDDAIETSSEDDEG
jgi:hypothetical protein